MASDTSNIADLPALEQFRQEWRNEVSAKHKQPRQSNQGVSQPRKTRRESASNNDRLANKLPARHPLADADHGEDHNEESLRHDLDGRIEDLRLNDVDQDDFSASGSLHEPQSALEHYERAVEKESQGNLGDSLSHYRKAYRLDAKVDQSYKNKHFSGKWKTTQSASLSSGEPAGTAQGPQPPAEALSFEDMIEGYRDLSIPGAKSIIEGDQEPPCPIRKLPTEVLLELLLYVAITDPSAYARLALVCKRFAYHVFTEDPIWKRVALGPEFGLASQHYRFATDVQGRESIFRALEEDDENNTDVPFPPVDERLFAADTDYREFFHSHPRIRFSGVYISTVNYTRAGGVSATPATWSSSVHIVTYYRYLRFFRDGTLISLLTTNEPVDVVHHLTKEIMTAVRPLGKTAPANSSQPLSARDGSIVPLAAQNVMKHALRGRWRLCHPTQEIAIGPNTAVPGDIHLETEGAAPRYTYIVHLSLKSGSRSKHTANNNKLVWKGYWKYNHLTDDLAEFALKNDKAFFFSRVRSYGLGY